ncbi:hypothetical protein NEMBOFW57_007147 [Staphylotrichum longicolle]|uniref:Uncharacterized protein n=1 Tax=Staphylotrichum longicolle TaxID=669026 RepID=A0AAD4EUQ5_9PEZI|nr:hypothetical protein NEMBOFW57_007147 [Staphylotrichum longicolle]
MDYPLSIHHLTLPAAPPRELWSSPPGRPPLVSRVCREARFVALNHHKYVTYDVWKTDENGTPCPEYLSDWGLNAPVQFRKGFDIVHLNWHKDYVRYDMCNPPGFPWETFQWLANQAAAASVTAGLLLPFEPKRPSHWYPSASTTFDRHEMRYFSPHRVYYVVLAMVEIHISAEEAAQAGVFGLLGEEPIQLVDPRDAGTIAKFRDVWRRHQSGSPSDEELDVAEFFSTAVDTTDEWCARVQRWRGYLDKVWLRGKCSELQVPLATYQEIWPDSMVEDEEEGYAHIPHGWLCRWDRRELNREHPWVQTQLALMPRFEPAVMFRHCLGFCGRFVPTQVIDLGPENDLLPGDPEGVFRHIAARRIT